MKNKFKIATEEEIKKLGKQLGIKIPQCDYCRDKRFTTFNRTVTGDTVKIPCPICDRGKGVINTDNSPPDVDW